MELDKLTDAVLHRVFIELEASGRHVHVTEEQAKLLFGHGLTPKRELSQPGQYLAQERVTVIGPKGKFQNVAVLGPERGEGQVEVSLTDQKTLGITAPIRLSGDVENTPGIVLEGPEGTVTLPQGVIIAQRHIHMTPESAKLMGVENGQIVSLQTYSSRPVLFQQVAVRVSPHFRTRVHLDYDEANACGFCPGDLGRIVT